MKTINVEDARCYQSSTNTTTQHIHGTGVSICCLISNTAENVLSRGINHFVNSNSKNCINYAQNGSKYEWT